MVKWLSHWFLDAMDYKEGAIRRKLDTHLQHTVLHFNGRQWGWSCAEVDWEKKLDVFTKKLLILPIHKQLHWSLCCVGNPSAVTNSSDEEDEDLEVSYMLFLDPLDYHDRSKVCQQVREWLNAEWNRKNKTSIRIFTPLTMKCFSPKGKIICITYFHISIQYDTYINVKLHFFFTYLHSPKAK